MTTVSERIDDATVETAPTIDADALVDRSSRLVLIEVATDRSLHEESEVDRSLQAVDRGRLVELGRGGDDRNPRRCPDRGDGLQHRPNVIRGAVDPTGHEIGETREQVVLESGVFDVLSGSRRRAETGVIQELERTSKQLEHEVGVAFGELDHLLGHRC